MHPLTFDFLIEITEHPAANEQIIKVSQYFMDAMADLSEYPDAQIFSVEELFKQLYKKLHIDKLSKEKIYNCRRNDDVWTTESLGNLYLIFDYYPALSSIEGVYEQFQKDIAYLFKE